MLILGSDEVMKRDKEQMELYNMRNKGRKFIPHLSHPSFLAINRSIDRLGQLVRPFRCYLGMGVEYCPIPISSRTRLMLALSTTVPIMIATLLGPVTLWKSPI